MPLAPLLICVAALVAIYAVFLAILVFAGRRGAARAVAGFIPDCLVLLYRLLADRGLSRARKLPVLLLIAYLALPLDLVPDFIPVAGQLDDALLLALVLRFALRGAGPDALSRHWPGPPESARVIAKLAFG